MKTFFIYLIIIVSVFSTSLSGQTPSTDPSKLLTGLYSRLLASTDDKVKTGINDSIVTIIDKYVRSDSVLTHKFSNLRYLGQIVSPDMKIKIITWNLVLRNSPGIYYCYIIKKAESGTKNEVYRMKASYKLDPPLPDGLYTDKNWYGTLYFDILPIKTSKGTFWMLFGIDYGNSVVTRKLIDVLSFTEKGTIVFGKKWFVSGEDVKSREVFEFSSDGTMSLRFESDKKIIFDHLSPFTPQQIGEYQFYGPSSKYDAYIFKKGLWYLEENVDARNKKPKKK